MITLSLALAIRILGIDKEVIEDALPMILLISIITVLLDFISVQIVLEYFLG